LINKERIKKNVLEYREKNKDKISKYREKNRDRINQKRRERRLKDPVKFREYQKKWQKNNPNKVKDAQKKYYQSNKEARKLNSQKWINENKKRYLQQQKTYNITHREDKQLWNQQRRLSTLTHYSLKISKSKIPICANCGSNDIDFLHIDHIIGRKNTNEPKHLRGGSNLIGYLAKNNYPKNYQVLCGNCNWLKHFELKQKILSNKKENVRKREVLFNLKKEVFTHYSKGKPKCSCCRFDNITALTIDHIQGRKNVEHRQDFQGKLLYYWLRRNNYPKGFQVLCIMCNLAKHDTGICPHTKSKYYMKH
jgi:hypothetical protein